MSVRQAKDFHTTFRHARVRNTVELLRARCRFMSQKWPNCNVNYARCVYVRLYGKFGRNVSASRVGEALKRGEF